MSRGGRFGKYGELKRKNRLRQARCMSRVLQKGIPTATPIRRQKAPKKSTPITLRKGTPKDRHFVNNLSRKVFSVFGDYAETVPRWLDQSGVITVIAQEHSTPLGFAILYLRKDLIFNRNVGELLAIAVVPEHQGRGIGRTLLAYMESLARKYGATELRLSTAEMNKVACRFFEKAGFTPIGARDSFYPAGQRALEMSKRL